MNFFDALMQLSVDCTELLFIIKQVVVWLFFVVNLSQKKKSLTQRIDIDCIKHCKNHLVICKQKGKAQSR